MQTPNPLSAKQDIHMIQVDFSNSLNPILSSCSHSIPQLFHSSGVPLTDANRYMCFKSKRLAPKSLNTVGEHLKEFFLWLQSSSVLVPDITEVIFESYADALCEYRKPNGDTLSWNTINSRVSEAYRFIRWCINQDAHSEMKLSNIQWAKPSTFKKINSKGHPSQKLSEPVKFLHLDDAVLFVKTLFEITGKRDRRVKLRNRLIGELMLQSGLRVSELVNFPLNDLPEVSTRGHSTAARVIGKGNKPRAILIPNTLLLKIWEYVDIARESIVETNEKIAGADLIENYLFLSTKGRKLSTNWVEKLFQKVSSHLNLKSTPHTLRHTYGTYHYLINKDLSALSSLMGHESVVTTESYYVHTAVLASYSGCFDDFQKELDRLIES